MKKCLSLLFLLIMLLPCFAQAEEPILINKIKNPDHPFEFPEDAKLLEVWFPRIDDCDAAFIRYGEYTMLLDCAGEQWQRVQSLLSDLNVNELTYAFVSHPHTDHIYGFHHLLDDGIRFENFVHCFPEDHLDANKCAVTIYDAMRAHNVPFTVAGHGDTIDFGDVKMTVYQRWDEEYSGNNNSALLKIELGERSILFTADIQKAAQLDYVNAKDPLQADILKHPHHGYNKMQYAFLKLVNPEMVVVTSGSMFANGVALLKDFGVSYHYTERGVMRFATDGTVWTLERFN